MECGLKGKLLFVAGAATGYVLGARAGRKRYEQIKNAAEGVWNAPPVQKGVDVAKDFARQRVSDVSDLVFDQAKKLIHSATKSPGSGGAPSTVSAADTHVVRPAGTARPRSKASTAEEE